MADLRSEFLWKAAVDYEAVSPFLSRHLLGILLNESREVDDGDNLIKPCVVYPLNSSVCRFCSTVWKVGNHSVKLRPKMKLTKTIEKLTKKQKKNQYKMTKEQRSLLDKFQQRCVKQIHKCGVCKKKVTVLLENHHPKQTDSKGKRVFLGKTRTQQNKDSVVNRCQPRFSKPNLTPKPVARDKMLNEKKSMSKLKNILQNLERGRSSENELKSFLFSI